MQLVTQVHGHSQSKFFFWVGETQILRDKMRQNWPPFPLPLHLKIFLGGGRTTLLWERGE